MADLVFTTRGQAEALAAQERLARVARDTKLEFEAGAKATQAWDSAQQSLKRSAEASLRAVTTEQEKITQQIENIKAAYREGLILKPEAEQGVQRLRQRWVDVDTAIKGSQKTLGTVPAEINKIEKPTNRVAATFEKAFDPIKLAKFAASFVSVGTVINVVRSELEDLQDQVDTITSRQAKGYDAAVAAGDKERAARLAGAASVKGLESGAQAYAETLSTSPYLSSEELADLQEIQRSRGMGWIARKAWSLGPVSRERAADYLRFEADRYERSAMTQAAWRQWPEQAIREKEQMEIMRRMADSLDRIDKKGGDGGGIPVDGS